MLLACASASCRLRLSASRLRSAFEGGDHAAGAAAKLVRKHPMSAPAADPTLGRNANAGSTLLAAALNATGPHVHISATEGVSRVSPIQATGADLGSGVWPCAVPLHHSPLR